MMVCDNMKSITLNSEKAAANMMSIAANSVAVQSAAAMAIDSAQLAQMVSTINQSIAANSAKIGTNMMSVASNAQGI